MTGIGAISPIGFDARENWRNIVHGKSGIRNISAFDASEIASQIAGQVDCDAVESAVDRKVLSKSDRFIQLGALAAEEAVQDAGLLSANIDPARIGVYTGSGIGGIGTIEKTCFAYHDAGPKKISPFYIPMTIINMFSGYLSIKYDFRGPNLTSVAACTTGTLAIGESMRLIRNGDCDVVLAGSAEAPLTPVSVGGFARARALSKRNDDPEHASRPWDQGRDGFVISEGAAMLVLEELEHAQQRGAPIYAEICGFGMSADAYHITQPHPEGRGASLCMRNMLVDAQVQAEQVDYINAHGTSTVIGDAIEVAAIKEVFDSHAYKMAVSSTKSQTGHLLGAAGALEAVYCIQAITEQTAPATRNLKHPDSGCDLDFVAEGTRAMDIRYAASNSFGFGGTNGSLLFARLD